MPDPAPALPDLHACARALRGVPVLVVGDVMLDHYLSGDAQRISPEAPVPVMRVEQERHILGGAGNVARNIAALGGQPELVSVVGNDDPGRALQDLLGRENLVGHLVVDKQRKTTIKTRVIARNQQMIRIDREDSHPLHGGSLDALDDILRQAAARNAVILVSDYGKGVVCQRVMQAIARLKAESANAPLVLVDPKVVNADLYAGVDLLTPNAKEAGEIAGLAVEGRDSVIKAGLAMFRRMRCRSLCVTLGAQGMAVFEKPGRVVHVPTVARQVFDVTGAGDTVISVLALALGAGAGLVEASVLANYAAGHVVAQVGTAVTDQAALAQALDTVERPELAMWLNIE